MAYRIEDLLLLLMLQLSLGFELAAQTDPRQHNHSATIVEFEESGQTEYYVTWSSSYDDSWEHDIYSQIVYFDTSGEMQVASGPRRYIGNGSDEAQEPVSIAINENGNVMLSAWEDGSGATIDIHGQLHHPDGTIIKRNWIIAGGFESQHSPAVAHLAGKFVVAYTDEAPPAQYAMIKAEVLDGETGASRQSLNLTAIYEDNWWPVAASDHRKHALIGWGDGSDFYGAILVADSAAISRLPSRRYLTGISQYYYEVAWLEHFSRFIAIVKSRGRSLVCLIDTTGTRTFSTQIPAPITRETRLARHWDPANQTYRLAYPTHIRDIAVLSVSKTSIRLERILPGDHTPALASTTWPSTGIAGQFVTDINGNDLGPPGNMALFAFNDSHSDNVVLVPITLDSGPAGVHRRVSKPEAFKSYPNYPNPFNPTTTIQYDLANTTRVTVRVFDLLGREVRNLVDGELQTWGKKSVVWDGKNRFGKAAPGGVYICRIQAGKEIRNHKMVLLQ